MTQVFYGGKPGGDGFDGIELDIIETVLCSRQPIYDGPTRLYDQLDYQCYAYLNPGATSYKDGGVGRFPIPVDGEAPTTTDAIIRNYLNAPNRQLTVTVGNDVLVSSPAPGMRCDAKFGPKPYGFELVSVLGLRTFVVKFCVRTWINPCPAYTKDTAVVLSHRWTNSRDTDQDGYSTLISRGHAVFDVAKLIALKKIPDDFWDSLARPLERGFRRDSIQVVATEDGESLEYVIVDRQTPLARVKSGVSRIECTHSGSIARGSLFEAAKDGVKSGLGAVGGGAVVGAGIGSFIPVIGTGIGAAIGGTIGFIGGFFSGAADKGIPQQQHEINVRVWGYSTTPKWQLQRVARAMIADLLVQSGVGKFQLSVSSYVTKITRDVAGRWVQVSCLYYMPPLWAAEEAFEQGLGFAGALYPRMPIRDSVDQGFRDGLDENPPRVLHNPAMPGGPELRGGTRGDWIGKITAQALTRSCQQQPQPPSDIPGNKFTVFDTGGVEGETQPK